MEFKCTVCNKPYKSYQSLWNHNKKFHSKDVIDVNAGSLKVNTNLVETEQVSEITIEKSIKCKYCNKVFTTRQAKSLHIKKYCKQKEPIQEPIQELPAQELSIQQMIRLKELEVQLVKEQANLKKEQANLKEKEIKLLKLNQKIEPTQKQDSTITPNKINKLLENFDKIQTPQKSLLYTIGKFNINEKLTLKTMIYIAKQKYFSIETLVEIIYCGKFDEYKSIIVTNINTNYVYVYDEKTRRFLIRNKKEVLNQIVEYLLGDLDTICELVHDHIDELTRKSLKRFIHELNYDKNKYKEENGTIYETYRHYVQHKICYLLHHKREKIMNDISCFVTKQQEEHINSLVENSSI